MTAQELRVARRQLEGILTAAGWDEDDARFATIAVGPETALLQDQPNRPVPQEAKELMCKMTAYVSPAAPKGSDRVNSTDEMEDQ